MEGGGDGRICDDGYEFGWVILKRMMFMMRGGGDDEDGEWLTTVREL